MTVETKDIWQGAYLLAQGGRLAAMRFTRRPDGKRWATFHLAGEGMGELIQKFKEGQAVCNVKKLRAHVGSLKQAINGGTGNTRE